MSNRLSQLLTLALLVFLSACTGPKEAATEQLEVALDSPTSTVKEMNVDGMRVLFKPSTNEVISANLFINGGMANYTLENEGIENLALYMVTNGGTKNYPRSEFFGKLEKMGSSVNFNTGYDYSTISLRCVKDKFEESWPLFKDAILNPAFNAKDFDLSKQRMVATAQRAESDPDTYLRKTSLRNTFEGLNYAKNEKGTPESLEALGLDATRAHYKKILNKTQCALVIVGNLDEAQVIARTKEIIGSLPAGTFKKTQEVPINISSPKVNMLPRDIKTNYMRGYMNAPGYDHPDKTAMQLAMSMLSKRLWIEVRSKRNLSYAPYSAYASSLTGNPYCFLYASTDDPNQTAQVMIDEIKKLRADGFTPEELASNKALFVTYHYLRNETNSSQATNLGAADMAAHWSRTEKFIKEVELIDLQKLNTVFNKYTKAIEWTYLGNPDLVDQKIFNQPIQ